MKANVIAASNHVAVPQGIWNEFWFSPAAMRSVDRLRIIAGMLSLIYWLTWLGDAPRWFSSEGFLSSGIVRSTALELGRSAPLTPIMFVESSVGISAIVLSGIAISALLVWGVRPAISASAAFLLFSAWINRAPEFMTSSELIVGMLLFALLPLFAVSRINGSHPNERHWSARLTLRSAQVAATFIFIAMAVSIVSQPTWRNGTAVWELAGHSSSRPTNLEFLRNSQLLVNAWTHAITGAFVFLPIGLWLMNVRRAAGTAAILARLSLIPITGEWFAALAVIAAVSPFFLEESAPNESD